MSESSAKLTIQFTGLVVFAGLAFTLLGFPLLLVTSVPLLLLTIKKANPSRIRLFSGISGGLFLLIGSLLCFSWFWDWFLSSFFLTDIILAPHYIHDIWQMRLIFALGPLLYGPYP